MLHACNRVFWKTDVLELPAAITLPLCGHLYITCYCSNMCRAGSLAVIFHPALFPLLVQWIICSSFVVALVWCCLFVLPVLSKQLTIYFAGYVEGGVGCFRFDCLV